MAMIGDTLLKICGCGIIAALFSLLLKRWGGDFSLLLRLVAGVAMGAVTVSAVSPILSFLTRIAGGSVMEPYLGVLLRVLCVSVITNFSAVICRDLGEASLAGYVELGGKIEILLLSLPLMEEIVEMVGKMI